MKRRSFIQRLAGIVGVTGAAPFLPNTAPVAEAKELPWHEDPEEVTISVWGYPGPFKIDYSKPPVVLMQQKTPVLETRVSPGYTVWNTPARFKIEYTPEHDKTKITHVYCTPPKKIKPLVDKELLLNVPSLPMTLDKVDHLIMTFSTPICQIRI